MRITKENLTRYDQHFKSWHRRRLGCANALENWHQTEEAGAVQFYPVGGSPLEGKVKFSFTETPPASGDKSPTNPSVITGVSSVKVTRCGKNLARSLPSGSYTLNGIVFTVNQDGSVLANGTASADASLVFFRASDNKDIYLHGNSCVISGCPAGGSTSTYFIQADIRTKNGTSVVSSPKDTGSTVTYSNASERRITYFAIKVLSGCSVSNLLFHPQIEFGSTATTFEPYEGSDSTLPLSNTYYGGEIDLATGLMTVTHLYYEFTGAETRPWSKTQLTSTSVFNTSGVAWHSVLPAPKNPSSESACSHFPFLYAGGSDTTHFYIYTNGGAVFFYPDPDMTVDEWKAYLATQYTNGTPVTLCYEVAVPTTVQLSPLALSALAQTSRHEPRLNTVYTDADSIQITYQKSPIRAATEQETAILGLGGNI